MSCVSSQNFFVRFKRATKEKQGRNRRKQENEAEEKKQQRGRIAGNESRNQDTESKRKEEFDLFDQFPLCVLLHSSAPLCSLSKGSHSIRFIPLAARSAKLACLIHHNAKTSCETAGSKCSSRPTVAEQRTSLVSYLHGAVVWFPLLLFLLFFLFSSFWCFQKHYESKAYKKALKSVEQILKRFPDHGGMVFC